MQENRRQFILDQAMEEVMWDLGHKISLEEVRAIRDIFIRVRRPVLWDMLASGSSWQCEAYERAVTGDEGGARPS